MAGTGLSYEPSPTTLFSQKREKAALGENTEVIAGYPGFETRAAPPLKVERQ